MDNENVTLRQLIENAIKSANGDVAKAAIAVCVVLDDEFDFGDEGNFDDDPELQEILINRCLEDQ